MDIVNPDEIEFGEGHLDASQDRWLRAKLFQTRNERVVDRLLEADAATSKLLDIAVSGDV